MKRVLVLFIALMVSGCAFGHKISYEGRSNFNIQQQGQKIIVAVHDMRPYVQNNDKSPDYAGYQKSIAGIPYNVKTSTGKPLADDFGELIVNTMLFRKITASQQIVPYSWSFDEFKQNVLGKEKDCKVYYIKMAQWETETHFRSALDYDLKLTIFDEQANELSNNQEKGYFYFNDDQPGKENLGTATSAILEKLFAERKPNRTPTTTSTDKHQVEDNILKNTDAITTEKPSTFKSLPPGVKDEIKRKCSKDHPDDFAMQADCASKQATGWLQMNK